MIDSFYIGSFEVRFYGIILMLGALAGALPRSSLEGRVETLNANLKIASTLTPKLRMSLAYVYNDHDDKTPQATYTWVSTDTFVSTSTRTNLPYSFTKSKINNLICLYLDSNTQKNSQNSKKSLHNQISKK